MQVQGGNHMKNTFVLNGLNITIEGQPIAIDKLEVTSEMSAQELATSVGLISGLIKEIKPLIQEATNPTTVTTPNNNYNRNNNYKNKNNYSNYNKNDNKNDNRNNNYSNYNKNDNTRTLEIQQKFDALIRPAELTEEKSRSWVYEYGSYNDGDRIKVNIDNTKFGVLHVNIMTCHLQVHIHVYPDKTTWHGASSATFCQLIKHIGMPEAIQAYLLKVVTL